MSAKEEIQAILEEEANVIARWNEDQKKDSIPNRVYIAAIREIKRLRDLAEKVKHFSENTYKETFIGKMNPSYNKKHLTPCRCGNTTNFILASQTLDETTCEIWIKCGECGWNPEKHNLITPQDLENFSNGQDDAHTIEKISEVWNNANL